MFLIHLLLILTEWDETKRQCFDQQGEMSRACETHFTTDHQRHLQEKTDRLKTENTSY